MKTQQWYLFIVSVDVACAVQWKTLLLPMTGGGLIVDVNMAASLPAQTITIQVSLPFVCVTFI